MDIQQQELYELPLGIDCSSKIHQPYIITKQCINEQNEHMNVTSDLLVIGFYDKEQKVKIISINNQEQSDQAGTLNKNFKQ